MEVGKNSAGPELMIAFEEQHKVRSSLQQCGSECNMGTCCGISLAPEACQQLDASPVLRWPELTCMWSKRLDVRPGQGNGKRRRRDSSSEGKVELLCLLSLARRGGRMSIANIWIASAFFFFFFFNIIKMGPTRPIWADYLMQPIRPLALQWKLSIKAMPYPSIQTQRSVLFKTPAHSQIFITTASPLTL